MNKSLLATALLLLCGLGLHAQKPLATFTEMLNFNSGKFEPNDSTYYTYNGAGNVEQALSTVPSGSKWVKYQRVSYQYDSQKRLTEMQTDKYMSAWQPTVRTTYTYDMMSGGLTKESVKSHEMGMWEDSLERVYYGAKPKQPDSAVSFVFDDMGEKAPYSKDEFFYNSKGHQTRGFRTMYEDGQWAPSYEIRYDWDGDVLLKYDEFIYMNNTWMKASTTEYTYDGSGNVTKQQRTTNGTAYMRIHYLYTIGSGITAENLLPEVNIFPHPVVSDAMVTIEGRKAGESMQIQLYDLNGRVVLQQNGDASGNIRFNRASLPNGVYMLRLSSEGTLVGQRKIVLY